MIRQFAFLLLAACATLSAFGQSESEEHLLSFGLFHGRSSKKVAVRNFDETGGFAFSYIHYRSTWRCLQVGLTNSHPIGGINQEISAFVAVGFLKSWSRARVGGFLGPVYMSSEHREYDGMYSPDELVTRRVVRSGIGLHQSVLLAVRATRRLAIRLDLSNEVSASNHFKMIKLGLEYCAKD